VSILGTSAPLCLTQWAHYYLCPTEYCCVLGSTSEERRDPNTAAVPLSQCGPCVTHEAVGSWSLACVYVVVAGRTEDSVEARSWGAFPQSPTRA